MAAFLLSRSRCSTLPLESMATRDNVIKFLAFASENPNSIVSCLRAARENARTIRESISPEMWEQVNSCYLMVNAAASSELLRAALSFFSEVKKASQLFHGITDATLLHGEEWHFYRMGRLLERADKTSRLLDVKYFMLLPAVTDVGTPLDDIQWAAVLRSASALEMYRKRHGHIAPEQIIEFLVLDHEFPRSIHYCLTTANDALHAISGTPIGMFPDVDGCAWPERLPLPQTAAIYDLVYNPPETRLIQRARMEGLRARNGLGMLIEQAALAFEIWTGCKVPRSTLEKAIGQKVG